MAQQAQGKFGYQTIQFLKTEPLGSGSYGAVYKAMCDDLPCAGKILHPTLFQSNDPGAMTVMRRFQQECNFLSAISHPNIVQYLGSYQDPETRLPVLLMELMDDSLTRFLEQSQEPLPYCTQVNICHDIALALAYLHSNDIIHRDLSSNNVLVIGAGNRAKVTDFGMAKLFDVNSSNRTPLTMCPGTLAYMSPEALDDPPVYTKNLDTFSLGVLGIQIITRQFPNPGPRMKKVRDPRFPVGIQVPVPETERRKSHIDLIDPTHPLLPIATDCLSHNEEDRPSAQDLCHCLAALKEAQQYGDSVQQAQGRSRPAQRAREDRERQIRKLQQEKEELRQEKHKHDRQVQDLQQQLQVSDSQIREKDAVIAAREQEIQRLRQEHELVTQEQDRNTTSRENRLQELLVATARFQQDILQREKKIQDLQEENQYLQHELRNILQQPMVTRKGKQTLRWKMCNAAPYKMKRGSASGCGNMAFFGPYDSSHVHSYNSETEEWFTFPRCSKEHFSLAAINGIVTAVGGRQSSNCTNTLLSLTASKGGKRKWVEHFPPMPTKREFNAVTCSGKDLLVAGGRGEGYTKLATVEVMNTDTLQWSTASHLPYALSDATATICGDRVYLVGGLGQDGYSSNSVLTCSLSTLLQTQTVGAKMKTLSLPRNQFIWHTIADLPMKCSTCVTLNGQLLAIGGYNSDKMDSNNIHSYNTETSSWELISHMHTSRRWCLVTVLPDNKLMVVGGQTNTGDLDTVEFGKL